MICKSCTGLSIGDPVRRQLHYRVIHIYAHSYTGSGCEGEGGGLLVCCTFLRLYHGYTDARSYSVHYRDQVDVAVSLSDHLSLFSLILAYLGMVLNKGVLEVTSIQPLSPIMRAARRLKCILVGYLLCYFICNCKCILWWPKCTQAYDGDDAKWLVFYHL